MVGLLIGNLIIVWRGWLGVSRLVIFSDLERTVDTEFYEKNSQREEGLVADLVALKSLRWGGGWYSPGTRRCLIERARDAGVFCKRLQSYGAFFEEKIDLIFIPGLAQPGGSTQMKNGPSRSCRDAETLLPRKLQGRGRLMGRQ